MFCPRKPYTARVVVIIRSLISVITQREGTYQIMVPGDISTGATLVFVSIFIERIR